MNSEQISPQAFKILENVVFLKKTALFSAMRTHDLRAVASIAEELTYEAGDLIVRENDVGDSLYLIKEGRVKISKKVKDADPVALAELGIGDCFGDMAVFDAELRSASANAKDHCILLKINGDDLIDVIVDCPYIAIEFLKMFVKRLRKANVSIEELTATAHALRDRPVTSDTTML
jgi:CRP-like cAMP-binding protein